MSMEQSRAPFGGRVLGSRLALGAFASSIVGVLAAGSALVALSTIAYAAREGRQSRELDRFVFTEATSIAFFVTMLVALACALLESWFEVPPLSMWVLFTVGMFSWGAASIVLRQKLT